MQVSNFKMQGVEVGHPAAPSDAHVWVNRPCVQKLTKISYKLHIFVNQPNLLLLHVYFRKLRIYHDMDLVQTSSKGYL